MRCYELIIVGLFCILLLEYLHDTITVPSAPHRRCWIVENHRCVTICAFPFSLSKNDVPIGAASRSLKFLACVYNHSYSHRTVCVHGGTRSSLSLAYDQKPDIVFTILVCPSRSLPVVHVFVFVMQLFFISLHVHVRFAKISSDQ